jgi:copper homeostasis protein
VSGSKKLLEVIVTSAAEAREAEQGGADRLELVSDLELEGLTPPLSVVEEVLRGVSIPVRVMLRHNESFAVKDSDELRSLKKYAGELADMPVNGMVLGFVNENRVDSQIMNQLLACCATKPATFHRAFESIGDEASGVADIKTLPRVDRILTSGGAEHNWAERLKTLEALQKMACPEITIVTGGGLDEGGLAMLAASPLLNEFHVGRAARDDANQVQSGMIRRLRSLLG